MRTLHELLAHAVELGASDIHLTVGEKPAIRVAGSVSPCEGEDIDPPTMRDFVTELVPSHLDGRYDEDYELDFSHEEDGVGRFRVNVFMTRTGAAIAMRHVKDVVPTVEELRLPKTLKDVAMSSRGIVLVCGSTGSGKSTTLAAMIGHINHTEARRIITIEDPVEYLFRDEQSIISQREVGLDTGSFGNALKRVLRQDPDVIMIGEMRDRDSFMAALSAAETGHLVFSTLHTSTAYQSISRILDFVPRAERDQMRTAIGENMRAIIAQRLIPAVRGGVVVPAVELLINTPTVRKLILEDELDKLYAAVETGGEDGMQSFDQALHTLIVEGLITERDGMRFSTNPQALTMRLKGIYQNTSSSILN